MTLHQFTLSDFFVVLNLGVNNFCVLLLDNLT